MIIVINNNNNILISVVYSYIMMDNFKSDIKHTIQNNNNSEEISLKVNLYYLYLLIYLTLLFNYVIVYIESTQ